ncbi:Retrotransposon gag protein [Arachis hypogaea]|nr:Retrotransposon gag protein [Arachis hypogaea]
MPLYVKFMKELLLKKMPLKGDETVVLTKKCSAIIQNNLPRKMLDPRSFQISCTIGSTTFEKALCDMGASINLMPLSVIKKLQIQEEQPKDSITDGRQIYKACIWISREYLSQSR